MSRPQAALQTGRSLVSGAAVRQAAAAWAETLGEVPLFAGLSRRHLRRVAGLAREVRFHDGSPIVRAGDEGETFYVLLDGEAVVSRKGLGGVRLGPGSFFGEMALLDGGPRSATLTARGDVVCLAITRARFLRLLRSEPTIAIAILQELSRRVRALQAG